jgi:hypothetical protein
MVELEQQVSEIIEMYCKRAGAVCRNAVNYPSNNPINQCTVRNPAEVIAAFEGNGCIDAVVSKFKNRKVVSVEGTMTVERFKEKK